MAGRVSVRSRCRPLAAGSILLLLLLPGAAPVAADAAPRHLPGSLIQAAEVPIGPAGEVTLLVELGDEPVAQVYAASLQGGMRRATAAATSARAAAAIVARQDALRIRLPALRAVEVYSLQRVLDALVVRVDASRVAAIRQLPGVVRVSLAPQHHIDNNRAVPFVGANTVWDSVGGPAQPGLTGLGITIGVIDTGIDYLHANFGGARNYATQNPAVINSDGVAFPTARVVGGWDFAGDAYNSSGPPATREPVPDPDPTDCNGHGSHVAGTAAGSGVDGGTTWAGGYDGLDAATIAGFEIGPGAAPEASLFALKVFGCSGSSSLVLAALERAVDPDQNNDLSDHLDVVNLSVGSSYGWSGDLAAIANLTAAGVIVVGSAGNSGDTHYIVSSPGSATEAISVAASVDDRHELPGVEIDRNDDETPDNGLEGVYQPWSGPLTTATPPTYARLEAPSGSPFGCSLSDFAGFTDGHVAWVQRGGGAFCSSAKLKVKHAEDQGASAVVFVNSGTGPPIALGNDPMVGPVGIPAVMISGPAASGITVGPAGDEARLVPGFFQLADTVASFSSRGPRRGGLGELVLKPDVAAPGLAIVSTQSCYIGGCTGTEAASNNGSSMAAPLVSGVMALLRQQHPTWTVAELKALLMTTAAHDVSSLFEGVFRRVGTSRVGAGRIDASRATAGAVFAHGSANAAAVSLAFGGEVNAGETVQQTQRVTVVNRGATAVSFDLVIDTVTDTPGVSFSVSPADVDVPAAGTAEVDVTVTCNGGAMIHTIDPTNFDPPSNAPRHWLSEETAHLVLEATSGTTVDLRLPLYAAPRPVGTMHVAAEIPVDAASGTVSIPLAGTGLDNDDLSTTPGGLSQRYRGQLAAFELVIGDDPEETPGPDALDGADIRHVGVISDVGLGGDSAYLGVAMWGEWDSPVSREIRWCLDLDQDGSGGALGDGTDWCWQTFTLPDSDIHQVRLVDVNNVIGGGAGGLYNITGHESGVGPATDTRIFDNEVVLLAAGVTPEFWAALNITYTTSGLPDSGPAFDFTVTTGHRDAGFGVVVDATPRLTYDPGNAAVWHLTGTAGHGTRPLHADLPGTWDFGYDLTKSNHTDVEMLFLHYHNATGDRVDVARLDGPFDNAAAALVVSPTNGLETSEAGQEATFQVTLATGPTGQVNVDVVSNTPAEGTVAPSPLTFTVANWDDPQTVTATGVDDAVVDGHQPYTVSLTVAPASGDPRFTALAPVWVSLENLDDPLEGFFHTLAPCRLLDTREPGQGPAPASGEVLSVTAHGTCGVPVTARALAVNVTVTAATGAGAVIVWDGALPATDREALFFAPGQARANNALVPLAADGSGTFAISPVVADGGTVHVVVDVAGWFE